MSVQQAMKMVDESTEELKTELQASLNQPSVTELKRTGSELDLRHARDDSAVSVQSMTKIMNRFEEMAQAYDGLIHDVDDKLRALYDEMESLRDYRCRLEDKADRLRNKKKGVRTLIRVLEDQQEEEN